jgi:ubiquinone/menaquinone biosynthesis C-methylase UbiE
MLSSFSGLGEVVSSFRASPEAALRTAVHTGAHAIARRAMPRPAGESPEALYNTAREIYELNARLLARPGFAAALREAEREDLWLLPVFLGSLPLDLLRIFNKQRSKTVRLPVKPPDAFPYPDYYLNDFHNQKNGNLSLQAALTYELQIRILFLGANRLMRQGVIEHIPPGEHLDILDVACGTGAWLGLARPQGRRHHVTGIDLSPAYLKVARRFHGGPGSNAEFLQMNAEALRPEWSGRFDVVTCIWLLHELPRKAQERAVAEMARVLKPGGALILMDSAQEQDYPVKEAAWMRSVADWFARSFNEPYFKAYQRLDVPGLLRAHGFRVEQGDRWFRSKIWLAHRQE